MENETVLETTHSLTTQLESLTLDRTQDLEVIPDEHIPEQVTFNEIKKAEDKLGNSIVYTPCEKSDLSEACNMSIFLKMDFLQKTGSCKDRGARYVLSTLDKSKKKKGVVVASLGNNAKSFSFHGQKLDIPVTVVVPVSTPIMKIAQCFNYNAKVHVQGKSLEEANEIASKIAKTNGSFYINGCDNIRMMAAEGAIGLEILNQLPAVDAVVVPVGGGGLLAGVAVAVKTQHPKVLVIGVQSENSCNFAKSMGAGQRVLSSVTPTMAESLEVSVVGTNAFATAVHLVDKMVVVQEKWIALALLRLVENEKCLIEAAGAVPLAAVLSGQLDELKGKSVVLLLTGGNINTSAVGRSLERGLAADGRLIQFVTRVVDYPGAIAELCQLIASIGCCIKHISQEKTYMTENIFGQMITCVCETRDQKHSIELTELVKKNFKEVDFGDSSNAF